MGLLTSAYGLQTAQVCSDTAWSDSVDPHLWCQLSGQLPNHPYHGVLRGGIQHTTTTGVEASDRGGKDHAAFSRPERWQRRFGSQQTSRHINAELLAKGGAEASLWHIFEAQEAVKPPGIPHQDVQLTEGPHLFCHSTLVVLQARDIPLDRAERLAKIRPELL